MRPGPVGIESIPAPCVRAGGGETTNSAHVNARNLRYLPGGSDGAAAEISYLSADFLDLTPQDPLSLWTPGSYRVAVQAAHVSLGEAELNRLLSGVLAKQTASPLKQANVTLLGDNRFGLSGTLVKGLSLPFTLTARTTVKDSKTIEVQLESIKVFGLSVTWLVKLLGIQRFLPAALPVTGKGGTLSFDLDRQDRVRGDLKEACISRGKLTVVMGGAPEADVPAELRANNPNYCAVEAQGEVALESAILRDAKFVAVDSTPADGYTINRWDTEGEAKIRKGQVILSQDKLRARFAQAEGFSLDSLEIEGTDIVVKGTKAALGFDVPVRFKLEFSANADGALQVRPHDIKILGMGILEGQVFDALEKVKGMHRDGDLFTLNLREAASAVMPPLASVTGESGRLVLQIR